MTAVAIPKFDPQSISDKTVFITGPGGSGKTYLEHGLRRFTPKEIKVSQEMDYTNENYIIIFPYFDKRVNKSLFDNYHIKMSFEQFCKWREHRGKYECLVIDTSTGNFSWFKQAELN